jgi:hypothetical protein
MNKQLTSISIYYDNLNKLITECVTPAMDSLADDINFWFWERSCIGGKHLKVRWREQSDDYSTVKDKLSEIVSEFLLKNPSKNSVVYNSSAVKRLVETEKRSVSEEELEHKIDCVVETPYERKADEDASEELLDILHKFLSDTRKLCTDIISSGIDRNLTGLWLTGIFAIEQFGSLEAGCITFRAHWDNYENWFKPSVLPERIKQHYESNKPAFHKIVKEIMEQGKTGEVLHNPVYAEWVEIIQKYRVLIVAKQNEGVVFMPASTTPQGVIDTSNYLNEQDTQSRSEEFLRRLYSEPNYLGSLSVSKDLQETRIMVNLVYHVISNLGVSAYQRMAYCYFLHRSVEEVLNIDILDKLDEQMKSYLSENQLFESEPMMEELS